MLKNILTLNKRKKMKAVQYFESPCGKAKIYVENDLAIGVFHDFLMHMKGLMVDRMVEAHKQQIAEMSQQKEIDQASGEKEE